MAGIQVNCLGNVVNSSQPFTQHFGRADTLRLDCNTQSWLYKNVLLRIAKARFNNQAKFERAKKHPEHADSFLAVLS
jgi:hypothetical protein